MDTQKSRREIGKWIVGVFTCCVLFFLGIRHIGSVASAVGFLANLFSPLLIGIVLAAVTIGGTLGGPIGMLLGVPAASSAYALLREATVRREANKWRKCLLTKEELENKIATYTGGRAAEEIVFGQITTGASNDIEQATKLARAMITQYGMNEEFDMVAMETVTNQYLGGDTSLACSAETQKEIDKKVVALVKEQHEKAKTILRDNREALDRLAQYLYEKESITGEEFMDILRGGAAQ